MSFDFSTLVNKAVAHNSPSKKNDKYTLPPAQVRDQVRIKDGNRPARTDGEQALVLVFGRFNLSLDAVVKGATRINALAHEVEQFTGILQDAIDAGEFDDAIAEVQQKALAKKEQLTALSGALSEATEAPVELPEALSEPKAGLVSPDDLNALDDDYDDLNELEEL